MIRFLIEISLTLAILYVAAFITYAIFSLAIAPILFVVALAYIDVCIDG